MANIRFFLFSAIFSVGTAADYPGYWRKRHTHNTEDADYKNPVDIEYGADAPNSNGENFFQEIYMLQSAPKQIEFGHVCENPHEWEQRYEKKDFNRNRHQGKSKMYDFGFKRGNSNYLVARYEKADPKYGVFKTKVRWADKRGNHGEHYWDYNHAGPSSVKENENKEHKQQHKRQLNNEEKEVEAKEEDNPLSEEAQEFLESFHREIEGVFNLRLNQNFFPEQGSDSFKQLTNNFKFSLPKIKNQSRKSKRS